MDVVSFEGACKRVLCSIIILLKPRVCSVASLTAVCDYQTVAVVIWDDDKAVVLGLDDDAGALIWVSLGVYEVL